MQICGGQESKRHPAGKSKGSCDMCVLGKAGGTTLLISHVQVWIDVLLGSGTAVELCHVMERGAERKFTKGRQAKNKKAAAEALSDLESEEETEMNAEEEENFNVLPSSQEEGEDSKAGRRARDSDEFLPSPKRRKVEVVLTPRKRRKG